MICAFCGEDRPPTNEHVLGQWMQKEGLLPDGPVVYARRKKGTPPSPTPEQMSWQSKPFDWRVKDVCAQCNNGWMSEMEGAAKPLLLRLIAGHLGHLLLSAEDQRVLAAWAYKTSLTAELMDTDTAVASAFQRNRFMKEGEPGGDAFIALAAFPDGDHAHIRRVYTLPDIPLEQRFGITTILLRGVALQVWFREAQEDDPSGDRSHLVPDEIKTYYGSAQFLVRINPSTPLAFWPPGIPLQEGDFPAFQAMRPLPSLA